MNKILVNRLYESGNRYARRKGSRVFIGHGRSTQWLILKEFIKDSLNLEFEEYNRESPVGLSISERLEDMLLSSSFAFLVLTAEDEQNDGKLHARQNVIHETGLFQGGLGFRKATIIIEEGCEEFSNIKGLNQIRFPRNNIRSCFEDVRQVLKREELLTDK